MSHKHSMLLVIISLFVAGAACNMPLEGSDGGTAIGQATSIAQTVDADPENQAGSRPTETPADTEPSPDTETPSPTATATDEAARVHVTGDTNCRTGPGEVYGIQGAILAGEKAQVEAQDPSGSYWYVVDPDEPANKCWIWGGYATPQGPVAGLPVYTPRPTPTPQVRFAASYERMLGYDSVFIEFSIQNTGGVPLESVSVKVVDKDTGATAPFRDWDDFGKMRGEPAGKDSLDTLQPEKKGFVYSDFFQSQHLPIANHAMEASLRACTQDGLNGSCTSRTIQFQAKP